jgi:ADP-dependent NAD(P)H-hydrate dehydratase / NAD(P)H-hydrate epimerase
MISHPILSCAAAGAWEAACLGGDETREWAAMCAAGQAVAEGIQRDFAETHRWPRAPRLRLLAGKGHNAGDAFLAAAHLLGADPAARVEVAWIFGAAALRPLAARAWRDLATQAGPRLRVLRPGDLAAAPAPDVLLDGGFGFSYRPPLPEPARAWLHALNTRPAGLRAAVDLPTGWDDPDAFRADFTYATGIVKTPLLDLPAAGRPRYLDLGFFPADAPEPTDVTDRVLRPEALLRAAGARRDPAGDKRHHGHVLLIGGSRRYPGAILLAAHAALRSGVGLVDAAVPASLAPAYAAQVPEVMWCACPETDEGGLSLDAGVGIRELARRATAWLIGPGLGAEPETHALAEDLLGHATVPLVLDASALVPALVAAGRTPRVLTPHAGEYHRIAGDTPLAAYARPDRVTVLKGPVTRISAGAATYHSFGGGPVLARGGSGDVLAGLVAGRLAQCPADLLDAAATAVAWHGAAADRLARRRGQVSPRVRELVDELGPALRKARP